MPSTSISCSCTEPGGHSSARTRASIAGIVSSSFSPTLTTASTRRLVSKKCGARASRSSADIPARYNGKPSANASYARCNNAISSWLPLSTRAVLLTRLRRVSTVSKSASASSSSTMRKCSSGSSGPMTSGSLNARNTYTIASTSRMLARNLLPRPSPLLAPSTKPPMSTTCTAACTMLFVCDISDNARSRWSGTLAIPMFGSFVAKG